MQISFGNETGTYVASFPGHTGTLFPTLCMRLVYYAVITA